MMDLKFLGELQRFRIVLKRKVLTKYAGTHRATSSGSGTELMDMRKYVLGDDIRLIDWNIYARTEKLHVKRFREEKNLTLHIIIDYSKSMDFGNNPSKYDYSAMIGIGLAYLSMKNNERFEFSAFSDEIYTLKPRKGSKNFYHMVDMINKLKPQGRSKFYDSIAFYKKLIRSRSLIIIISDFLYDVDEIKMALLRLGTQHDIKLIQVLDKEEIDFKLSGDVKLIDSETSKMMRAFFTNRTLLEYRNEMNEHIQSIKELSTLFKAQFISVNTSTPIFEVFSEILHV
jgi:uncharacterized protein (DUF58 family)